jgi:hypothetical protein
MEALTPVYTSGLFPALHAELIRLLRGLDDADWVRPTVAGSWRVRDVAAHLLDVDLRKLADGRDRHRRAPNGPLSSFDDIVGFINRQNAEAVSYGERLSPRLITDLLAITGQWVSEFVATLSPHEPARAAVAWAGEEQSETWMDVGREYTERWHHQMQIRDAVGALLLQGQWFLPVLDLSVRAFPRAYDDIEGVLGTAVVFEVDVEGERVWSVVREASGWRVARGEAAAVAARVCTDADTAWRILYNALTPEAASSRVTISGERSLAEPMLGARSVMV